MFVRNSWYAAAWSSEVGHRQPLARTVIDERLVLFRTSKDTVAVLEDRCAHRHMPLSMGRILEDDRLVCPYHGLTYAADGACVHVPGRESPGPIRIRHYPSAERAGLVFVWMGAFEDADPDLLPDCGWLDRPGWHRSDLYRHAEAGYLLLNDNLADLLHVAYLHIPSGGGNEDMGPAETTLETGERGYDFQRHSVDIPAPASYRRLSNAVGNIDRWHVVEYRAPSFYRIHTGVAETGKGGADSTLPAGQGRWAIRPHHFITPETEYTTHYFQVVAHESPPTSDSWRFLNAVIDEDVWAIEHQQAAIRHDKKAKMQPIPSDAPTIAMRRIVERMVRAEGHQSIAS